MICYQDLKQNKHLCPYVGLAHITTKMCSKYTYNERVTIWLSAAQMKSLQRGIKIMKWAKGKDKIRGDYKGERATLKPVKKDTPENIRLISAVSH